MMHCFSEYEKKYLIITFTAVSPDKVAKYQLRDYLSLNKYKEQYSMHWPIDQNLKIYAKCFAHLLKEMLSIIENFKLLR